MHCCKLTTTDTDSHENTPEDDGSSNGHGRRAGCEGLSDGSEDDDDQFKTVHLLTTDDISEETETKLTDDSSSRGSDLDGSVGGDGDFSRGSRVLPVDDTKHSSHDTNGEDVVGIGEETDTSDQTGADMVPAERSLVNLSERESAALIGVGDMGVVVVEVVEGAVASSSSGSHHGGCLVNCLSCDKKAEFLGAKGRK